LRRVCHGQTGRGSARSFSGSNKGSSLRLIVFLSHNSKLESNQDAEEERNLGRPLNDSEALGLQSNGTFHSRFDGFVPRTQHINLKIVWHGQAERDLGRPLHDSEALRRRIVDLEFEVCGLRFWVCGLGFGAWGLEFWVWGLGSLSEG